jgi:mannose-6-phosphate isomerase-like protein (cupin superfamily)
MSVQLEPGLILTETQPPCIKATFTDAKKGAFVNAEDERGQVFLFERLQSPAVFVEVIRTLPNKVRGNHVHYTCDETLHVVSGKIELYLLCEHQEHVFKRTMRSGEVVTTPKGTPHALYSQQESECVVLFDKDPRNDRDRVPILVF